MNGKSWQLQIYEHTAKRGYVTGWTDNQFAARQVVKAIEELAELVECVDFGSDDFAMLQIMMHHVGKTARELFDNKNVWKYVDVKPGAGSESCDVAVTLANFAAAYERISGQRFDVLEGAMMKAEGDIERGVRSNHIDHIPPAD